MTCIRKLAILFLLALPLAAAADSSPQELLASGQVDNAIALLHTQIQKQPNDAEAQNLLCRSYLAIGKWDRGIAACEKAVALDPNNGRYHLWLGRVYGEKADHASFFSAASLAGKVRTEFETAVRLSPNDISARTDLAEFYLEAPGIVGGGRDKAEAQAQTLTTLDPAKACWVRARMAEKRHDDAEAEKQYRAAVEASHGGANAWINLAFFLRARQRYDEMEDAINHAVSAQMNTPEVLMEGAETLIRAGRNFPKAIQLLKRYLSNKPVEEGPAFKAHYLLGSVLEQQGDKQHAAEEYRQALAMAKDFSRAQEALDRLNR